MLRNGEVMFKVMSIRAASSIVVFVFLAIAGIIGNLARAQISAPFVGTWKASWQTDKKSYDAVMKVTESGGSWQTFTQDRNNPCVGREVPIKVELADPTDVKLVLLFSEVIPGCSNATVTLKAASDGTVTGMRSKFVLTLAKQ
jgi:hypothetical protein